MLQMTWFVPLNDALKPPPPAIQPWPSVTVPMSAWVIATSVTRKPIAWADFRVS